jgi:hypothetical protein
VERELRCNRGRSLQARYQEFGGFCSSGSRRDVAMRRRPRLREMYARDSQWLITNARRCRYGEASSRVLPRVSGVTLGVDALAFTALPPVGTLTTCSQPSDIIRRPGSLRLIVQALPSFHRDETPQVLRRHRHPILTRCAPCILLCPRIYSKVQSPKPSSCSHTVPHHIQMPQSTNSRHQFATAQNTAPHPVHLPFTVFEASI